MANSLTTNPIVIDSFGVDVVISERPITVKSILFTSNAAGDILVLEDRLGVPCFIGSVTAAKETMHWNPAGDPFTFQNGLVLDVSDGTYIGASKALIYLE